jgi:pentapeptide MXKDX repeat protein
MLAFSLLMLAVACDTEPAAPAKPKTEEAAEATQPPPISLKKVHFGEVFLRSGWYASYTEAQITAISDSATAAATAEAAASTEVAKKTLEVTQLVADGSKDEAAIQAAAAALAIAERAYAELRFTNLLALVGHMGPEQLDAGGNQSAATAVAGALTNDPWLGENNPLSHVPPEVSGGSSAASVVTAKLAVARSALDLQTAVSAETGALAALDLTAPDWQGTAKGSATRVYDALQKHRTGAIEAYTKWAIALPEGERVAIVLADGTKAALALPSAASASEGQQAGGMQGGGMQGGGMQGGGMQGGGMQGGGMQGGGMQGGGMQGGGMPGEGMQGGGMQGGGMQPGGMQGGGMQGGGMQGGAPGEGMQPGGAAPEGKAGRGGGAKGG